MTNVENFLWVEKYRPKTIGECILPITLKKTFQQMVDSGECQNLLLSGGPGCGKTTVAKALCHELKSDYIVINCSEDGNIDTLRTTIRNFASTVSFGGGTKVVILDEFDYSNPQSMQPALRGFIEEFAKNCRFILTCNYKSRIIEPLHSRCTCIDFKFTGEDKMNMCSDFMERIKSILKVEQISFDEKILGKLILKFYPDFRRLLNELQRYSVHGKIDSGILSEAGDIIIKDLMKHLKEKDFMAVRKWLLTNIHNDPSHIFRKVYDGVVDNFKPDSVPTAIIHIGEYQNRIATMPDQEVNLMAFFTHLMLDCEFK